uniref:Uncharacterized protein n=1 Tax=Anopheles christyi TaxID=43041 RepID=A0A182K853_9DIPT
MALAPSNSTHSARNATADSAPPLEPSNKDPVPVTTHIENAAGDKLDFKGDHFFGRDKEEHDYNRQAHLKLEYVRNQDPQLRRFLGKAIVKRQADYPYPPAVYPPTHYEPPTTTTTTTTPAPTTTTTTTTTPAPTTTTTTTEPPPPPPPPPTTTPGVPHEVYGLPGQTEPPQPAAPLSCPDCSFAQLPPLPELVYPSVPAVVVPGPPEPLVPPPVLCTDEQPVPPVDVVPSQEPLYSLNELVGVLLDSPPVPSEPSPAVPATGGPSGCSECNFAQLPALPELVYPSLAPASPTELPTQPSPPPPPPLSPVLPEEPSSLPANCLPVEHRVDGTTDADLVDLRLSKQPSNRLQPRVLSTHSQVILVQSMAPYPVLKANHGHTLPKHINRGALKFTHSRKESNYGAAKRFGQEQVWNRMNDDTVVVLPAEDSQGQLSQIVVCTVDCNAVEDRVHAPETPAGEIPSDGRLW